LVNALYQGGVSSFTKGLEHNIWAVRRGFVTAVLAAIPIRKDDPTVLQASEALEESRLADSSATVQHASVAPCDAVQHLRETDGVALALETEGAPDNVEQHLEF
jgi:hypothetical protein